MAGEERLLLRLDPARHGPDLVDPLGLLLADLLDMDLVGALGNRRNKEKVR